MADSLCHSTVEAKGIKKQGPSIWFLTSLNFLYTPKTTIAPTYLSITLKKKIRQRQNKNKKKMQKKRIIRKKIFMLCGNITTSRWFKCVPTFHGSLSIHIFMLLFRFLWDFTWKCEIAIEIRMPFDDMCDNFLLVIVQKRTVASILKILLLIS